MLSASARHADAACTMHCPMLLVLHAVWPCKSCCHDNGASLACSCASNCEIVSLHRSQLQQNRAPLYASCIRCSKFLSNQTQQTHSNTPTLLLQQHPHLSKQLQTNYARSLLRTQMHQHSHAATTSSATTRPAQGAPSMQTAGHTAERPTTEIQRITVPCCKPMTT